MNTPTKKTLWIAATAVAATALAIVMVTVGSPAPEESARVTSPIIESEVQHGPQPEINLARRIDGDTLAIGAVDAPVVMVEYADYRCPFCGVFSRESMPKLTQEFVDSGQLRVEWRDLPVFGEESVAAAVAARAAGLQGMFWEYHDALYAAAPERGHPDYPRTALVEFARGIGVPDLAKFEADLDNTELEDEVFADLAEGSGLGIYSTPSFAINNTPIVGAQPLEVFREAILDELKKAK
ncbi:DsbA family protein [Mycetocola spongiae]|uniref:DsbA family protein n=1 Tax=Mycetocola spongiae TaxID=2859226 RepID=UPI001CF2A74D|nr:DsbA family protein [Mycetocola spongiae]UCR88825.1 DsbA family protein [Mycetocola spongiae]